MTSRVAAVAIFAMMALAFLPLASAPALADVPVAVEDFAFVPQNVTIPVGETITWTLTGGAVHTTTSGVNGNDPNAGAIWESSWLFPGESYPHTFTAPGVYQYFCRVHDGLMSGTVTVGRVRAARFKGSEDGTESTSWGMIKGIYR